MSIDKWISGKSSKTEEKDQKEKENGRNISKENIEHLKKQKIRQLLGNKTQKNQDTELIDGNAVESDFLLYVIEFKDWLNKRHYLKGDLEKIETWICNLHDKLNLETAKESFNDDKNEASKLRKQFKDIPLNLIEEKMRIAIYKKLRGMKKTSSDTYYLKKLKKIVQEKLKEAQYYEILNKILE